MNGFLIVAGAIGVLGGIAHATVGHRWTVGAIDASALASTQNTQAEDERFLAWFWQVGSVVLLSTSALLLGHGLDLFDLDRQLLWYLSFLWLATTAVFFVVAGQRPSQIRTMIPGLVGVPVNALILAGLLL